ncbi:MAG TPA: cytochrome c biogenesis protein ResB [Pyrinomonadaceae bacterium]|nr:cytochrome c biogenesis protein ResB [Pyrinomonadaceae bacterium]
MSAIEETKKEPGIQTVTLARTKKSKPSILTGLLNLLSSVKFGVSLLVLLAVACMIGMLIMQQSVENFDKYYAELMPSQKIVYGSLGFFDIYHAWYFNALLLVLSLNIVLASIDRFPGAWIYISRKKLDASKPYILNQKQNTTLELKGESREAVAQRVSAACRGVGLKPSVMSKGEREYIFAEKGAWNRLGAYAVHVALLTTFFGGFLTAQFGRTGQMPLKPGETAGEMAQLNYSLDEITPVAITLPFSVTCTDIQQKLIKRDGSIQASNTIDWLTQITIKDETGAHEALVHLNKPYDYRGYRFFQASFQDFGSARNIKLRLTPEAGGAPLEVAIKRDGSTELPDGTKIDYKDFQPDFQLQGSEAASQSGQYNNPAAILNVTTPAGERSRAFAFAQELPSGAPVGRAVGGYKFRLVDFEKVPEAHMLSIQRDPGTTIFYVGSGLLFLTLSAVFFFSHQRVWAIIEEREPGANDFEVVFGGNTNRNVVALEDRFKRLLQAITGQPQEVKTHE